jgi:6-phosphogluconolactonase
MADKSNTMRLTPEIMVDKPELLARQLTGQVERECASAIAARDRYSLALPGGSVAEAFLPVLGKARLDWSRVHVFWVDERAGPADGPDSNYRVAQSIGFLDPIDATHVHRMPADEANLERAARRYADELVQELGTPPAFDLVLLGLGPDGHVASLFPGHPLLEETRRWVAAVEDSPKPPLRRLTVTLPPIVAAGSVVVAGFGAAKGDVVGEALRNPQSRLPLALTLVRPGRTLMMLDPDCAKAAGIGPGRTDQQIRGN